MAYGWEGDKIRLVPLDVDKHWENAVQWMNDPEVTRWVLFGDLPITKLSEKEWFERNCRDTPDNVAMAIETLDGLHIGFSGIHQIDWRDGVGTTGTLIGDKAFWGKGYGSDVVKTRSRHAFEVLGLRMLLSGVIDGNTASFKMLTKNGYRECGRIPARRWKRGEYRDEILLCLSKVEWLQAQG